MAHVNGSARRLTTRLRSERDSRVKYSTLWPSRRDSPSAARRAIPSSCGLELQSGSKGREDIGVGFAICSPNIAQDSTRVKCGCRKRPWREKEGAEDIRAFVALGCKFARQRVLVKGRFYCTTSETVCVCTCEPFVAVMVTVYVFGTVARVRTTEPLADLVESATEVAVMVSDAGRFATIVGAV